MNIKQTKYNGKQYYTCDVKGHNTKIYCHKINKKGFFTALEKKNLYSMLMCP